MLAAACLLAAVPWADAQVSTPGGLGLADPGAPPPSFVLDEDDLFRTDPKTLREIRDRLGEFYDRHKLPLYLAVHAGLIGSTPGERHAVRDRIVRGRPLWRTLAELAHSHGQEFIDAGIRCILFPKAVRREIGGMFAVDGAVAAE